MYVVCSTCTVLSTCVHVRLTVHVHTIFNLNLFISFLIWRFYYLLYTHVFLFFDPMLGPLWNSGGGKVLPVFRFARKLVQKKRKIFSAACFAGDPSVPKNHFSDAPLKIFICHAAPCLKVQHAAPFQTRSRCVFLFPFKEPIPVLPLAASSGNVGNDWAMLVATFLGGMRNFPPFILWPVCGENWGSSRFPVSGKFPTTLDT